MDADALYVLLHFSMVSSPFSDAVRECSALTKGSPTPSPVPTIRYVG